jgi:hypothetical protein
MRNPHNYADALVAVLSVAPKTCAMEIPQAHPRPTRASFIDRGHGDGNPSTGRRHRWARAYRDSELVCARVKLTVRADPRLGLTLGERRRLTVRFLDRLDPGLRTELAELVDRRGAVARRAAERMQQVEIVTADPSLGCERIIGSVQPPQLRHGDLHDIEFGLRETTR